MSNEQKYLSLDLVDEVESVFEKETEGNSTDDYPISNPYDPRLIRVDTKTFSLRNVMDMIEDQELDLAPDFQRMRVWSKAQKSRLIESILLRIPLPAFYFSSDSNGFMQVVDGVQRLSTIFDFVRGNSFGLQYMEYLDKELGGANYRKLENTIWGKRINTTQITVNVIDPQTPTRVKFDIFKRINTGGTPLNSQEIRHCMSGYKSRDILARLTALRSFNEATGGKISGHIRMMDRELVLRWIAFTLPYIYGANSWEIGYASMEDFLNETSEYLENSGPELAEHLIKLFDHTMRLAYYLFDGEPFRKMNYEKNKRYPINKALFESISVQLTKFVNEGEILIKNKELIQRRFVNMCNVDHFNDSITVATSNQTKIAYRHQYLYQLFKSIVDEQNINY